MEYRHFGINLRPGKDGLKMTRDNYAVLNKKCTVLDNAENYFEKRWGEQRREAFLKIFEDTTATMYTDIWCETHMNDVLKNYDYNISYFKSLPEDEFNLEVKNFLTKNRCFHEIYDLNDASGKSGYYVMILGEYKQIYIGTSSNIKNRIMSHWSKRKEFDRLIWGNVETSKLSIDCFRALDTSRILVYFTKDIYSSEDSFINDISEKFCCNRTGGGIPEFGVISIVGAAKYRELKEKANDQQTTF